MTEMTARTEGLEFVLERVFQAPKEKVFAAFTQCEHLKHWWGPRGWELTACTLDLRPEGVWHYCMTCRDESQGDFFGMESWGKGVYREIDAPNFFVYTDYFSDAEGGINAELPPSDVTMIFEEAEGGGTLVKARTKYDSEESLKTVIEMGMEQGVRETWDRLEEYLR
ncbi:SRPBCC domain-containing protein [Saccharibacillus alkalitolerans]|uniref:SRPBCC domain-containing protein n=1 Tax=Saccharibacillus alkalitolerans TaxID=2705290 RepID=A0ABX0F8S2_9BACL|nr:SRPBCC domain-containing protein [Saccharibacillus alkalitolerans]NGZ76414.1 SRPBCC domain-containing protein [Saccharibacillus alkalitolerans]